MVKRSGLGRNLSVLLSQPEGLNQGDASQTAIVNFAITSLRPGKYQPRRGMDEALLAELAESIRQQGLLQPIVVREVDPVGTYEIIAGERRWRAAQLIGMNEIPVIIKQVSDEAAMAMALIENLQREDLNSIDQARALQRLIIEFSLTHQQVAELVCKSRTAVSNSLRLLNLNPSVQLMLERGDIDMGHARALLMLDDELQLQAAKLVIHKTLSVRETESLVARLKSGHALPKPGANKVDHSVLFKDQLQHLARQLQTKVQLRAGTAGKGTLIIHYEDAQVLDRMMETLLN